MISKTAMGVAAGVCGTLFIGYCIYFDRKRRSHPEFKKLLKEKRAKAQLKKEQDKTIKLPDFKNPQAMEKFFFQEMQLGEEFLSEGDIENAIEHLSYALAVSRHSKQLLELFHGQLPPPVFEKLLERMPIVNQKLMSTFQAQGLLDDDVE